MLSLKRFFIFAAACGLACGLAAAAPADMYGDAVSAYYARDYETATELFSELVDKQTSDPRVYYFRGLAAHAQGKADAAAADFKAGAELEASGRSRVDIGKALERVQGPVRVEIESSRRAAKQALAKEGGNHLKEKALKSDLTLAIEDYFAGRFAAAKSKLDAIAEADLPDPRVYYFRGLAQHELGQADDAVLDFEQAVDLETAPGNRIDVDRALLRVQGKAREVLESHRSEMLAVIREEERLARKELVASLVESRINADPASVQSGLPSFSKPSDDSAPALKPRAARRVTGGATPSRAPKVVPKAPDPDSATPSATTGSTAAVSGSRASSPLKLTYLPANTQVVVYARIADLWKAPLVAPLKAQPQVVQGLDEMKAATGLTPDDVESVTAGIDLDLSSIKIPGAPPPPAAAGTPSVAPPPPGAPPKVNGFTVVVRTKVDFKPEVIEATGKYEKVDHQGKSYYRATDSSGKDPCLYVADPRTLVVADDAAVKAVLDRADQSDDLSPRFSFADGSKHFVVAVAPQDPALLNQKPPQAAGAPGFSTPGIQKLQNILEGKQQAVAISLHVTQGIDIETAVLVSDAATATEASKAFGDVIKEVTPLFELFKGSMPPKLGSAAGNVLKSIKGSARKEVFVVSIKLTSDIIKELTEAASSMPLPGGPGGFPGLPGVFPPPNPNPMPNQN